MSEKTFEELDVLIKDSGLKLGYIAKQMDISRQRLYELRLDPAVMSVDQMEKIAVLLDVSFMDIYKIQKKFKKEVPKNATKETQEA